jgi:hypothetical protein
MRRSSSLRIGEGEKVGVLIWNYEGDLPVRLASSGGTDMSDCTCSDVVLHRSS